jgi:hypothetical protein
MSREVMGMSAAASRMIRILWIALAAALGLVALRPDVSDADGGAGVKPTPVERQFRGFTSLRAPALPDVLHAAVGPASAAACAPKAQRHASGPSTPVPEADLPSAVIRDAVAASPSHPVQTPHSDNLPPSPASRQPVMPVPPDSAQRQFPPLPESGQSPEYAFQGVRPSPAIPQTPEPEAAPVVYVVTAYYLNVRSEPDKTSPIRGLLEMGDTVTVVGRTDNGWLKLENGLYIHGAYAEPAEPERASAKNAGREVSTASASSSVTPEYAVFKPGRDDGTDGPAPLSRKVKSPSGLTERDIGKLLEGTELEGHGLEEAILGIEEEYGINALFTIAVMKLESGNGKSRLAREKNNLFGLNATGGKNSKAYSFETKRDSVYKFGSLIAKRYLAEGYTTIEKVGKKYCPANPKWASLVESIMKRDHRKLKRTAV